MTCVTFLSAPTPFAVMTPTLLLAPMEGLLDATLRDVLTRTGGLTSPNIIAMELAGYPPVALYAGSWSEWSRTPGLPVAKG